MTNGQSSLEMTSGVGEILVNASIEYVLGPKIYT